MKWSAAWISCAGLKTRPNACFRARKNFALVELPKLLPLHIAAESLYRLYVNGQLVARGPARGTQTVNFHDTVDIAQHLKSGDNWIAVDVHCHNIATSQANPVEPALLVQSENRLICTDDSWQVQSADEWRSDVPIFTYQVGYMEWIDHRQEPGGWRVGSDASNWQRPEIVIREPSIGGKALLARDIPYLRETELPPVDKRLIAETRPPSSYEDAEVAALVTTEQHLPIDAAAMQQFRDRGSVSPRSTGNGVALLADFRSEVNGRVEIDIDAPDGAIVDIGYEEEAVNGRLALTAFGYRFADRYILKQGRQIIGNQFASRGFRMVQVVLRNFASPIQIHSIRALNRRYPYPRRATFHCSDPLLDQIWEASVETISACSTDVIVDCPWRENTLWLNDLLVSNLTSLQAFGDPRMSARCLRLSASQPRKDGLLPGAVPAGFMPGLENDLEASRDSIVLLATNLFLANLLEEHLRYTGDETVVRELLTSLLRIHDTFNSWEDSDGLIQPQKPYWNFIDWSYPHPPEVGRENACVLNWFRAWSLMGTATLLEQLGLPDKVQAFRGKAARVSAATDRRFWNEKRNCYVECAGAPDGLATQVSHAVALLSGGVPPARMARVIAALDREDLLAPELYMQHLVLRALMKFGDPKISIARIRKYWGRIVLGGSPTIGECGVQQPHAKSSFSGAASLCHGFSTTPIDFFQSVVLGVTPTETGFRRCRIAPTLFDLTFAEGTVLTPAGEIKVQWQREGGKLLLQLEVPDRIAVDLPDGRCLGAGSHDVRLGLTRDNAPVASQ